MAARFVFAGLLVCTLYACGETDIDESLVRIVVETSNGGGGLGSGFVVAPGGYVATNHHVIDTGRQRRKSITVYREGTEGQPYKAFVLWSSAELDLAILEVRGLAAPSLPINDGELEKEDPVRAAGFPAASDIADAGGDALLISTRTSGQVSRYFKADWLDLGRHIGVVQHTAAINPGSSGGPLVNYCNEVVGVNTLGAKAQLERNSQQGISVSVQHSTFFASHAAELASTLRVLNIPADIRSSRCGAGILSSTTVSVAAITSFMVVLGLITWFVLTPKFANVAPSWLNFSQRNSATPRAAMTRVHTLTARWLLRGKLPERGTEINLIIDESRIGKSSGIILGRDPAYCDLVILHPTVSSRGHAKFYREGNKLMIADLKSTNGTYADGAKVGEVGQPSAAAMRNGMQLSLGAVRLTVERA